MDEKQFKVTPIEDGGHIAWEVIRINHSKKGDYPLATFYDRGAIQLFIGALEEKGFIESK
jgi:hypothetical protein